MRGKERAEHLSDSVALYLGDCREILPTLPPVDTVVTSPPYGQQRDYGKKVDDWRALVSGALCGLPSAPAAQILVNLGLVHRDGEVVPYWQPFIDDMRGAGWRHFGWYVWDQGFGLPGDWQGRLGPSHEFIFHFNRVARAPNKWVKVGRSGKAGGGKLRDPNGTVRKSTFSVANESKIQDSVVRVCRQMARGGIENEHPAIFPVEFANEMILSFSASGQIVCDPFMGSGTTGLSAVRLGRRFVGVEIEPKYYDIARRRISDALARPDLFIETPARAPRAAPVELPLNSTGRP